MIKAGISVKLNNIVRLVCIVVFIFGLMILHIIPENYTGSIKEELSDNIINDKEGYTRLYNGEIVAIINNGISDAEINNLAASFDTKVNILKHIDDYVLLQVEDRKSYYKVLESLALDSRVLAVQENHIIATMEAGTDPFLDTQWAINNPGYYKVVTEGIKLDRASQNNIDMDVFEAWEHMKEENNERREVIVAVIDTGIDYSHPDLSKNMWINSGEIADDGIDNDNNGYVDDVYGWDFYNDDASVCHYQYSRELDLNVALPEDNDNHGTHIAGVIGAVAGNNIGIVGIASNINIKIMSLKINGGKDGTGNISNAIEAIKYATMMGADICNLSWGTNEYSKALEEVIKEADMLFVAAAGNTGGNNDKTPVYPASFRLDNLISVTFINPRGLMTNLTNIGKASIDIAAPGEDIFSTCVGTYMTMTGSSMAAPHVSAVAALLYSYKDNLFPANIKALILESYKPVAKLKGKVINPGIPSALSTVLEADKLLSDNTPPEIRLETLYDNERFVLPVYYNDNGGSDVRLVRCIIGEKTIDDFKRGIIGTQVKNQQITVLKPGKYTFYISDYAGNAAVEIYEVEDDILPPVINYTYTVANDYETRNVIIRVEDTQSNIRRVKYMKGIKRPSDFLPAGSGKEITIKGGKGSFVVKADGIYSIYAIDNRGNTIVEFIHVKTVAASDIKFAAKSKVLTKGSQYNLTAYMKPINTTDKVNYTSSNERIAKVSASGRVEALKEGTVYVTARTSSGKTAVCKIVVEKH